MRPLLLAGVGAVLLASCTGRASTDGESGAPPPPVMVDREGDTSLFHVDHPEQFPLATATVREEAPALRVTGVVSPDVSRAVPVLSLTSGRVIEVRARLGDAVQKGQVLLRIQSADASAAFSDYRKAVADRTLAQTQLDRARALIERGAIAKKDLEVAQNAAEKAAVDVENAAQRLQTLGMDPQRAPTAIVEVVAPVSGVITEQNVTNAGGVRSLDNSPNLFTISDLSRVWIVCDVYEHDLPTVRVGDAADIQLAAYADRGLTGRISNIGTILDPVIRTAKVRIEVANPGALRIGMFVTATFHGQRKQRRAVVPASAILHLHDREWVYTPAAPGQFQRREVTSGDPVPGDLQQIVSGVDPGQQVVANALVLQNTVEQ